MLDLVLCYALLALLAVRPLISETFEPLEVSLIAALRATGGPTPATTAMLDTLQLIVALPALARAAPRARRSTTGRVAALGLGLLIAAVVISTRVAGDRPIALLAGLNLAIMALGGVALAALVQHRWQRQLVLAALLATGTTTALKCISQRLVENPQTRQQWEQVYRPELLRQGFDPDDPLFVNFERRMRAGETYGFLGHPNITGSVLMMCGLACAGLLLGRSTTWAGRAGIRAAALALVLAAIAAATWFTGSLGAVVAGALGLVVMLLTAVLVRRQSGTACGPRPGTRLAVLGAAYLALVAGGTAYGLMHGTLPHASLAFRWQYWTAAGRAYRDVPLTGLGRENFAAAYTQYKSAESTEEVRNPHNLWVSLLVELGPLGLLAGGLLAGAAVVRADGGLACKAPAQSEVIAPAGATPRLWPRTAPLIGTALALHLALSATPLDQPGAAYLWVTDVALPWSLALVLLSAITAGPMSRTVWAAAGTLAALLAALVHGLLDFALTTPAGLSVFVLLMAAAEPPEQSCAGERAADSDAPAGRTAPRAARHRSGASATQTRMLVGLGTLLISGLHLTLVTLPASRSAQHLRAIQTAIQPPTSVERVTAAADDASRAAPRDATIQRAAAAALARLAPYAGSEAARLALLSQARTAAEQAVNANPQAAESYALLAGIEAELAAEHERGASPSEACGLRLQAARSWERALARYPTNPRMQLLAGRAWTELSRTCGNGTALAAARRHFAEALRIDDLRSPGEAVRLRPHERLAAEQGLLDSGGLETRPGRP